MLEVEFSETAKAWRWEIKEDGYYESGLSGSESVAEEMGAIALRRHRDAREHVLKKRDEYLRTQKAIENRLANEERLVLWGS